MKTRILDIERSTSTAHRLNQYDGVCGQIHGHNMNWDVSAVVSMEEVGDDNMPVDLKDVSGMIDGVDHAAILNRDDPLLQMAIEHSDMNVNFSEIPQTVSGFITEGQFPPIGQVFVFEGDPTCEVLAQWMANTMVEELEPVVNVEITLNETAKYGISAGAGQSI